MTAALVSTASSNESTPAIPQPDPQRLLGMAWAYTAPLMIEAALHHKVFDLLDSAPMTINELSEASGASQRGLRSIANALVALEFLKRDGERYALTPESAAFLVRSKPSFQGGIFRHISTQLVPAWLNLREIVRTGKPNRSVNDETSGAKFFESFVEDIFPMSYAAARALGEELHLAALREPATVLDLAAGSGVWGIALAQQSPQVKVTAVDWPGVLPVTRRMADRFGLAERFSYIAGDILQVKLGGNFDIATLGHIIHSEGERKSRQLIKKTFDALRPGGTIAIGEWTPNDDRTGPPPALIFAVNMLVNTDEGDTFTFNEIRGWLEQAGFVRVRQLEAPAPSPLILANKP